MQAAANYCKNNEPENHSADVVQFLIFPLFCCFSLFRAQHLNPQNSFDVEHSPSAQEKKKEKQSQNRV